MTASAQQIENLRKLCGGPRDGALLRMSLANALLAAGDTAQAIAELRCALDFDPQYSAAWKQLGKVLEHTGDAVGAATAFRTGIQSAVARGDRQAEKEMKVFLRRLDR